MNDLECWRGAGGDIHFRPADFEIMDLALGIVPEARVCALVLKWARESKLQFPIQDVDALIRAFPHKQFIGGGHQIDPGSIRTFMVKEYFPIQHEGELLSRAFLGLMRCKAETSKSSSAELAK